MAREVTTQRRTINTAVAWAIGLLIFFPVLWTILTSFKTEAQAIADPPVFLFFDWTLENYSVVQERSDYMRYLWNSVIIAGVSTLLGIIVAVPAAWSMAFVPSKRTKDVLLWMLSTKMLPAVGCSLPDLPAVHPVRAPRYARGPRHRDDADQPADHRVDALQPISGRSPARSWKPRGWTARPLRNEILYVLTPMAVPGIASTMLLNFILAWNEAFWTLNLTAATAGPLTAFIASYSSPEGLFYAKLSAASTMAIAPILILGWFSQKQLVRGLTFGAVK